MKVKVIKTFKDQEEEKIRKLDEEFEVTDDKRAKYLIGRNLVVEVKAEKKTEKK